MSTPNPYVTEVRKTLEPFLEMLEEKEKILTKEEWIVLVNSIRERIINDPEQYLSGIQKSTA